MTIVRNFKFTPVSELAENQSYWGEFVRLNNVLIVVFLLCATWILAAIMTKEEIQASIKSIMFSGSVCGIEIYSLLDELEMRWEDEQKLNGLSSVHSMGFRQFIFYLAHKVDFIAEIFLCTMILFGNVGAQPAASFLLKFASFAKFLKQPESLCCFCTNQIFNFFSCNTAVFQCILKNE